MGLMLRTNTRLRHLILSSEKKKVKEEKNSIHHLMNTGNEFREEGAKALGLGLRANKGLWKLDISCESYLKNGKSSNNTVKIPR